MSRAAPLTLRTGDRPRLEALIRSTSVRAGLAQRARIVLLAAEGLSNAEIARRTGATRPTVLGWRNRYAAGGIDALCDRPRSGRPTRVDEIEVVAATLANDGRPPAHLGASHWSARLLGQELGVSFATVARIWRKWGIQPQHLETLRFPASSELAADVERARNLPARSGAPRRHRPPDPIAAPHPAQQPAQHPNPWLNLVEVSLGVITHQAIRRGTYASVHNLIDAIGALTDGWNERDEPSPAAAQVDPVTVRTATGKRRKGTSYTPTPQK